MYDNKGVILGSSFSTVKPSSNKRRWDSKKKDHCNKAYPDMVKEYNESMGGVDLNDMLISLYRMDIHTRKRWYLKIITHLVNIYNVKGCLLYKRYSEELQLPKKNQHNLLQFMKSVSDALLFVGKTSVRATPRRPKKRTLSPTHTSGKNQWFQKMLLIFVLTEFITNPNLVMQVTDA